MKDLLTSGEKSRLGQLEKIIQQGQKTFVAVGMALAEIKSSRLYKSEFNTFDQYCRERWGWKRAYAYHLIDGANAVKSLPPEMSTMVDTERQARELAKAPAEKRAQVIDIASTKAEAEDRPMTARDVREAAASVELETIPETGDRATYLKDEAAAAYHRALRGFNQADLPHVRNVWRDILAKSEEHDSTSYLTIKA